MCARAGRHRGRKARHGEHSEWQHYDNPGGCFRVFELKLKTLSSTNANRALAEAMFCTSDNNQMQPISTYTLLSSMDKYHVFHAQRMGKGEGIFLFHTCERTLQRRDLRTKGIGVCDAYAAGCIPDGKRLGYTSPSVRALRINPPHVVVEHAMLGSTRGLCAALSLQAEA
eukprot:ANDGO_02089.mRNA.1 hypothetical protein